MEQHRVRWLVVTWAALGAVAGCGGGGGSAAYDLAVDAANAKKAESVALALTSPCANDSQCAYLSFAPTATCGSWTYQPYSLVSTSAGAASGAATEQGQLARRAIQLEPSSSIACAAMVAPAPRVECRASSCTAVP